MDGGGGRREIRSLGQEELKFQSEEVGSRKEGVKKVPLSHRD